MDLVEGEGFEPSKAEPSDLQSDPFDRSGTPPKRTLFSLMFTIKSIAISAKVNNVVVLALGIEPRTY
jgi:hypothetical protein